MTVGQIRLDIANQVQLLGFEQRSGGGSCALDDVGHGDACHVPGEFAGFNLGEVENIVDELGQAFAFADDDVEVLDDLLLGLLHFPVLFGNQREQALFEAAANDLGKSEHGRKRGAELVADGGKKRALGRIGLFGSRPCLPRVFKELRIVEERLRRRTRWWKAAVDRLQ